MHVMEALCSKGPGAVGGRRDDQHDVSDRTAACMADFMHVACVGAAELCAPSGRGQRGLGSSQARETAVDGVPALALLLLAALVEALLSYRCHSVNAYTVSTDKATV